MGLAERLHSIEWYVDWFVRVALMMPHVHLRLGVMREITRAAVVPQLQEHVRMWSRRATPVRDRGSNDADGQDGDKDLT